MRQTILLLVLAGLCFASGCDQPRNPGGNAATAVQMPEPTLTEARKGFKTVLVGEQSRRGPTEEPPQDIFKLVRYPSGVGLLDAYLTPDPGDGKKHPAIIWITGGDCNSVGDVWSPSPVDDDQTAAAYRHAGIVMMFPSLRGGNNNPGKREGFYGEVDDVISALNYLIAEPYVDPDRIYLGGHSTGGTLAMLVAETTDRFRATFAFGPAADIRGYGQRFVYHDPADEKEALLRSPIYWLNSSVRAPLFVIEGSDGNMADLNEMKAISRNAMVSFVPLSDADHFSILAPANEAIAREIMNDAGPKCTISLTEAKLKGTN